MEQDRQNQNPDYQSSEQIQEGQCQTPFYQEPEQAQEEQRQTSFYQRPEQTTEEQRRTPFYQRPEQTTEEQRRTPFYQRPGQAGDDKLNPAFRPKEEPANKLASASTVLGIIAIASFFTFTIYPPVIFGSLAIILALLSRGASFNLHSKAKNGIITSVIAIGCDIALVAVACLLIFGTPDFFEKIYGMSYQEMMEGIENGTLDYDELYENIQNNMYENEID